MSKTSIIGLGIVGAFVLAIIMGIGSYMSANNTANAYEQSIIAAHDQSRNVLGQYAPKLKEALGVTKLQASAVEEVITKANESRYGEEGSQASIQWIMEQNPNLDQSTYAKILTLIEAGRNDFALAQKDKIDRVRSYKTALGTMPTSFFYRLAGYPTSGFFEKYEKIVISGHAGNAFETGVDDGVEIK